MLNKEEPEIGTLTRVFNVENPGKIYVMRFIFRRVPFGRQIALWNGTE
jgi:hypothetical protein